MKKILIRNKHPGSATLIQRTCTNRYGSNVTVQKREFAAPRHLQPVEGDSRRRAFILQGAARSAKFVYIFYYFVIKILLKIRVRFFRRWFRIRMVWWTLIHIQNSTQK
jgi:hypothetical protein